MRLSRQVVDLCRAYQVHDLGDAGAIHEVAVVQGDLGVPLAVGICAEVPDAPVVDVRAETQRAMDLIQERKRKKT